MRHIVMSLVLVCMLSGSLGSQTVDRFKSHTEFLASDELEGRGTGSEGIRLAADYIASQFESIGLRPVSEGSYFQWFSILGHVERESNVIGFIPAAVPTSRSVVFTAHYDAYGVIEIEGNEDAIHNGARDNAIGVAALIELARTFKEGDAPPQNLVFVATAGHELGRHGSLFYVENPLFPLSELTINLNIDGFNVYGLREDYFAMPRQGVDFIDEIESVGASLGWMYIAPDDMNMMNSVFDSAPFLQRGVPATTVWTGNRLKTGETVQPPKLGRIHTPGDEISELWNWEGIEDHLALYKAIADYFLAHPDGISVTDPTLFVP